MSSTPHLILGSNSPRRKQILSDAGYHFKTMSLDIDEKYPFDLEKSKIAKYLAKIKNEAYRKGLSSEVLLTADTTVIINNESLEKANTYDEAVNMLQVLSNNIHEVITGYCISDDKKFRSNSIVTRVYFKELGPEEIHHYVEKFQPFDKAGAYGIQEWIGMIGINKIEGSYFNVVGLPIFEIAEDLKTFGISSH